MLYTSYFANLHNIPDEIVPIAICGDLPDDYKGLQYRRLGPRFVFYTKWLQDHNNEEFTQEYKRLVLEGRSAKSVVEDLYSLSKGKDVVLICKEKPDEFCCRHLLADWLCNNGYNCVEFDREQYEKNK